MKLKLHSLETKAASGERICQRDGVSHKAGTGSCVVSGTVGRMGATGWGFECRGARLLFAF